MRSILAGLPRRSALRHRWPARRRGDRGVQPVRLAEPVVALEIAAAEAVLWAEVLKPLDHVVAAENPGGDPVALMVGTVPDARGRPPGARRDAATRAGNLTAIQPASQPIPARAAPTRQAPDRARPAAAGSRARAAPRVPRPRMVRRARRQRSGRDEPRGAAGAAGPRSGTAPPTSRRRLLSVGHGPERKRAPRAARRRARAGGVRP